MVGQEQRSAAFRMDLDQKGPSAQTLTQVSGLGSASAEVSKTRAHCVALAYKISASCISIRCLAPEPDINPGSISSSMPFHLIIHFWSYILKPQNNPYMSYSLNSLKGGIGDYIGDYYRGY